MIYLLYLICCWCVYPICVLVMSGHIKNNKYHILTEYMTVSLNHPQISTRFEMIHYHTVMICTRQEFVTRKISESRLFVNNTFLLYISRYFFSLYSMFKHLIFKNVRTRFSSCLFQLYNTC